MDALSARLAVWLAVMAELVLAEGGLPGYEYKQNSWIRCSDAKAPCPSACICQLSYRAPGTEVFCTGLASLQTLQNAVLPADTVSMDIISSNLSHLPAHFISNCVRLQFLNIYNNTLYSIHRDTFASLPCVKNLTMNSNLFNWSVSSLPAGVFDPLINLVDLQLMYMSAGNETLYGYRDDLFSALHNLQSLYIDGLPEAKFGIGFSRLANLELLYINGGLSVLRNSTFETFKNVPLTFLKVFSRVLVRAEDFSLSHFSSLKSLTISFSRLALKTFVRLLPALSEVNSVLEEVSLIGERANYGSSLIVFEDTFLAEFGKFPLRALSLPGLHISAIHPGLTKHLPNLESVDISNNHLEIYFSGLLRELLNLKNVTYINACCQFLSSLWPDEFGMDNSLSNFPTTIVLPKRLRSIDLAGTCHYASLPPLTFIGAPNLSFLGFVDNEMSHLKGPLQFRDIPAGQLWLDLAGNQVKFDLNTFAKSQEISTLHLTGSQLEILGSDTQGIFFRNASYLTKLVLDNTHIARLSPWAFRSQVRLKRLFLQHNYLTSVEFELEHMKDLELLDLSYNQLTLLSEVPRSSLDKMKLGRDVMSVILANNPILCSCESLSFLQWLTTTNVSVTVPPTCIFRDQRLPLNIRSLQEDVIPRLQLICGNHMIIMVAMASVTCSIFLVLLSICIYRQRWNIKFFCLKFVRARKKFMEEQNRPKYEYDAFIAYHKDDLPWVREELIPNLEGEDNSQHVVSSAVRDMESANTRANLSRERHFSCCIHQRDFMPGMPIEENIVESLSNSAKVIMVITQTFAKSSWCEFEMRLARSRSIDEGLDVIIPVLMEDLPMDCMSRTLAYLLHRNTYIQWPNSSAEREHFWEKLRAALRTRDPTDIRFIHCECGKTIEI